MLITEEKINEIIEKIKSDKLFNDYLKRKRRREKIIMFFLVLFLIELIFFLIYNQVLIILFFLLILLLFLIIFLFILFWSNFFTFIKNLIQYILSFIDEKISYYLSYDKKESFYLKKIISKYVQYLDKNFKYSPKNDLFPLSLKEYTLNSFLLKPYKKIILQEDSISFETDKFKLYWEEVKIYDDLNNTDHFYIFYVEVLNHKFSIKNLVRIVPDLTFVNNLNDFYVDFFSLNIPLQFIKRSLWWEKVTLENIDFEKIFDVYSESEMEARKLLTPKIMEQLFNLVKTTGKQREFAFVDNKIYIKLNLDKSSYMELSLYWGVEHNIKNFFMEIKILFDFLSYLSIDYFVDNDIW